MGGTIMRKETTVVFLCAILIMLVFSPTISSEERGAALDIKITGGLNTKMIIRNVGDTDALFVYWNTTITGGFIKKINLSYNGFIGSLPPYNDMVDLVITFPSDQIKGFGRVTITGTADSLLTSPVVEQVDGFLLFFFIILLP